MYQLILSMCFDDKTLEFDMMLDISIQSPCQTTEEFYP